jgi:hypothetical protein
MVPTIGLPIVELVSPTSCIIKFPEVQCTEGERAAITGTKIRIYKDSPDSSPISSVKCSPDDKFHLFDDLEKGDLKLYKFFKV